MTSTLRGMLAALFLLIAGSAVAAGDDRLAYFVTFGRADDVQLLLEQGTNPNAYDAQGWPLLAVAAGRRDAEGPRIVQLLGDAGADVNAADAQKHYPLLVAIKHDNAPVVQYLLAKGASIDITSREGVSAMAEAQRSSNAQIRQMMQQAAVEKAERERYARSPERRYELTRDYARAYCGYYYWNYYIASKQDDDETHRLAATTAQQALHQRMGAISGDLLRGFQMRVDDFSGKLKKVQQQLRDNLDALISNRNRRVKGVGTQADLEMRCNKVVSQVFPDAPVKAMPAAAPPAAPAAATPAAVPVAPPAPIAPAP